MGIKRVMLGTAAVAVLGISVAATALARPAGALPAGGPDGVPGSIGSVPAAAPGPETAGTITWAEYPGQGANWIFPVDSANSDFVYNVYAFQWLMWRPLYWTTNGVSPVVNAAMSLAYAPRYSDGDRTVSITLKNNYAWSDGTPLSADDLLFDIDLIKAAVGQSPSDWANYSPGGFPSDLISATTPTSSTLVLHLAGPVNPSYFTEDLLGSLNPLPAHAWARDSLTGPLLTDWAVNQADARRIYNFLTAQSRSLNTYATNPLWHVVDGPYRLSQFTSFDGGYLMTPNPAYGGPHAAVMSKFEAVPISSDAAEFNMIQAGMVDVGAVPLEDIDQLPQLGTLGYRYFGEPDFGPNFAAYNFKDQTGDFAAIVRQLYFRQAMAHLEDQNGQLLGILHGAGTTGYGPVGQYPQNPYVPSDAMTNPYPFSVPDAIALLHGHGWTVNPGGTDSCANPGTGPGECGAGIPAGTKLFFNLIYDPYPPIVAEVFDLAIQAQRAGISIGLVPGGSFNTLYPSDNDTLAPQNDDKWAMVDFGGETNSTYPTTYGVFNTGGSGQIGDYSNPTADALIHASVAGANPLAVRNEAAFLTLNQPVLFQPNPDVVWAWKSGLSGPPAGFEDLTQYVLTPEFWYFKNLSSVRSSDVGQ
jgi:peptide/nickel transport system substrate-binding protein